MTPEPATATHATDPASTTDALADASPAADAPRNRPARASAYLATGAVCCLVWIPSPTGLYLLGWFASMAFVLGLGAVVTGHVGHAVGRRRGVGRGLSVAAVVVGWLAMIVVAVGTVLFLTVFGGLSVLSAWLTAPPA